MEECDYIGCDYTGVRLYNCWLKTEILFSCFTSLNNNKEQDSEAEKQEFQELLDEYYNLQDHEKEMSAGEFITIDKNINIKKEELTDKDIKNIIKSNKSKKE
ncbi:hypothetical protein C1646_763187 [Rhizophagus diaphanus]|nr:hypothetical protein C1646_763187 [Rhizophagus diaphanus] [Rhizophagus sp. MUCL 43196]